MSKGMRERIADGAENEGEPWATLDAALVDGWIGPNETPLDSYGVEVVLATVELLVNLGFLPGTTGGDTGDTERPSTGEEKT